MSKKAWIIFAIISVLFVALMIKLSEQNKIDLSKIDINKPISASEQSGNIEDHVYNKNNSETVLIEYADYQCPACASTSKRIKEIAEKYKDDLTVIFRNFPLSGHVNALSAAAAAESAGLQGKYWEMHELLFENQNEWSYASAQERGSYYEKYAKQLNLDINKFNEDLKDQKILSKINFDKKLAAQHKVNATPTFVLNGKNIENNVFSNDGEFQKIIEEAIKSNK